MWNRVSDTRSGGNGGNSANKVCPFFLQGRCRFGDSCRNYHPPPESPARDTNRFGALAGGAQTRNQSLPYHLTSDGIKGDLTPGVDKPGWPLSAYGPGREAPRQLIEGELEQSPEELRVQYYLAQASGSTQQYEQAEAAAIALAEQQARQILNDIDGAVKYVIDAKDQHPNRIDATKNNALDFDRTQSAAPPAGSAFGQPSALGGASAGGSAFGRPSSLGSAAAFGQPSNPASGFGQPSNLGGSSTFGQPAAPASGFGQPSTLGGTSGFGQASSLGRGPSPFASAAGTGSAFGQPSVLGGGASAFGQPSALGSQTAPANSSPFAPSAASQTMNGAGGFGQPAALGQQSAFGNPSQFGTAAAPFNTTPFGQPSPLTSPMQTSPVGAQQPPSATAAGFGQPQASPMQISPMAAQQPSISGVAGFGQPSGASGFGQASGASGFGQPSNGSGFGQNSSASGFGQPSAGSTFGQVPSATGFGQSSNPSQGANSFGSNPVRASPFGAVTNSAPQSQTTGRSNGPLTSFKGQRIEHLRVSPNDPNDTATAPFYTNAQGRKERIWFPDGPPGPNSDAEAPAEAYEGDIGPLLKQIYDFAQQSNVGFKDGFVPEVPPKREWVSFEL